MVDKPLESSRRREEKKDIDLGRIYPAPSRIITGSYTGDGSLSNAITGTDFKGKYLRIWPKETADDQEGDIFETTDTVIDDNASGMVWKHKGS